MFDGALGDKVTKFIKVKLCTCDLPQTMGLFNRDLDFNLLLWRRFLPKMIYLMLYFLVWYAISVYPCSENLLCKCCRTSKKETSSLGLPISIAACSKYCAYNSLMWDLLDLGGVKFWNYIRMDPDVDLVAELLLVKVGRFIISKSTRMKFTANPNQSTLMRFATD